VDAELQQGDRACTSARRVPALVCVGWYPLVLGGSTGLSMLLIERGVAPAVVVSAVSLGLIPLCAAMEFAAPETPRWRLDRQEVVSDLLHMLISNPIPTAILRALLFGALTGVSAAIARALGFPLWPTHWPLVGQALLAIGVAEFVNYWIHRGLHRSRLWPLHAVHHCSRRMYFLLSVRKHPLQSFITYGGRLGALWLLGATEEAFAIYTVLISANSYLQHSNVTMSTGPLGYVFATPELHRVHHSRRVDQLDANYGDSLIVWDWLFGTRLEPDPARPLHDAIGLPGVEVDQSYAAHLRLPFEWSRLQAPVGRR
jgi:sterol desaturase/sphingolipid hydroxylase (fatty acid hydroxylase superfamily)